MRGRTIGLGALGGAAVIAGQAAYASLRRLPLADGFDTSGVFGDGSRPPLRLAVLGDSTCTGQGLASADDAWPRLVARHLADRFLVELRSYAVGGARSRNVLLEQVPAAECCEHDIAIVSVGSNDILRMTPIRAFERNLDEIIVRMQAVSRSVILFGVGDIGSIPRLPAPADRLASGAGHVADRVHRRVAARRGVAKIDQWSLTTEPFRSGNHMFCADLFHPSAVGHMAWRDSVLPTLEAELAGLGAR